MVDLVGVYRLHFSGLNGFIKSNISDIKEQKKHCKSIFRLQMSLGDLPLLTRGTFALLYGGDNIISQLSLLPPGILATEPTL